MLRRLTSLTGGIDIGACSVKIAMLSHQGARYSVVATTVVPIVGSRAIADARAAMQGDWARALGEANLSTPDVDYVASTGTSGSNVSLRISPEAACAGAYGAAILSARRLARSSSSSGPDATDPFVPRARIVTTGH